MEAVISDLVKSYENGQLSRRELIRGLAMLAVPGTMKAASSAAPQGSTAQPSPVMQASRLDHVSVHCSDLTRTVNFYRNVFQLPFLKDDRNQAFINGDTKADTVRLSIGDRRIVIRTVKPYGIIDHFALVVDKFDKASLTERLKQHGVKAFDVGDNSGGFHVEDPDGCIVQMISSDMRD